LHDAPGNAPVEENTTNLFSAEYSQVKYSGLSTLTKSERQPETRVRIPAGAP